MPRDEWYVDREKCVSGPHNIYAMRTFIHRGEISPDTLISKDGINWCPAKLVEEFYRRPTSYLPVYLFVGMALIACSVLMASIWGLDKGIRYLADHGNIDNVPVNPVNMPTKPIGKHANHHSGGQVYFQEHNNVGEPKPTVSQKVLHTPGQPYAFDPSTGKPYGVSNAEWSYLNTRMQSEFPEMSNEEAEVFARMAAEQARTGGP